MAKSITSINMAVFRAINLLQSSVGDGSAVGSGLIITSTTIVSAASYWHTHIHTKADEQLTYELVVVWSSTLGGAACFLLYAGT